jgi:hypothetical protein
MDLYTVLFTKKTNSVTLVHEQTIPTEQPPACQRSLCQLLCIEGVSWWAQQIVFFYWGRNCTHEAEWTPFQTHYYSGNLVAPGSTSGSVAGNLWPLDDTGSWFTSQNHNLITCSSFVECIAVHKFAELCRLYIHKAKHAIKCYLHYFAR